MCGRYWIEPEDSEEILRVIQQMQRLDPDLRVQTSGEIFPGDGVPVLCLSRAGNVRAFAMAWGYRLGDGKRIINARSETAAERPLFRDGMRNRRCLLPMSAYFEWEKLDGQRRKYRIAPTGCGLHYLAGLYRFEGNFPACTVLTTQAAPEIAFIHERMPVILGPSQRDAWLREGALDDAGRPSLTFTAI